MLELRSAETDKGVTEMLASASIETDRGMSATMRAGTEMSQFRTGPSRPSRTYCLASEM